MFEKLEKILNRYEEIFHKLSDPDILSDMNAYTQLTQELSGLQEVAEKYIEYKQSKEDLDAIKADLELNKVADDMKEFYHEAIEEASEQLKKQEEELKNLLVPDDEYEGKKVIVEIRAGVGGEEANIFADDLFQMYLKYAANKNLNVSITSVSNGSVYGIKEAVLTISGPHAYSLFKYEGGVHRVQRVPETEAQGRVHTSTATVAVYPEVDDISVTIDPKDIRTDLFHCGGCGGQHLQKNETGVRLTHIPTGIVVHCQDERSQLQNKNHAYELLRAKLFNMYKQQVDNKLSTDINNMIGNADRCEKIRTYNYPQSRVTDHRINYSIYNLDKFMQGNLDELVSELAKSEKADNLLN